MYYRNSSSTTNSMSAAQTDSYKYYGNAVRCMRYR